MSYRYEAAVGGKVAAVGDRLLSGAARVVIGGFFAALGRKASGGRVEVLIERVLSHDEVLVQMIDEFGDPPIHGPRYRDVVEHGEMLDELA